jgi:hypothetical protein
VLIQLDIYRANDSQYRKLCSRAVCDTLNALLESRREVFMAANPQPAPAHVQPTHLFVRFKIVTPEKLRQIIFTLERDQDAQNNSWSITFELRERDDVTQQFSEVIQLAVAVDHNEDDNAMATFKNGLDSDQHAQALVAGQTAKDASTGANDTTQDDAKADAAGVVSARNPNSPS